MKPLAHEEEQRLFLREIPTEEKLGANNARVRIHTAGLCCSDVDCCWQGGIGPFVVRAPVVLGRKAAGVVEEKGTAFRPRVRHAAEQLGCAD